MAIQHKWISALARVAQRASNVPSVILVELHSQVVFQSPFVVRLATGWYDVEHGGFTWYASGRMLGIEPIKETLANEAQGCRFTISGVPQDQRSLALDAQYAYPGRNIWIHEAVMDADYKVIETDVLFAGFVDKMTIVDRPSVGDGSCEITITCESRYARLRIANERRFSNAQQQALYPGDTSLRFLARMREDNTAAFGVR